MTAKGLSTCAGALWLAASILPVSAASTPVALGPPFQVNTTTAIAFFTSVAMADDDSFAVAWSDSGLNQGDPVRILARRFAADGTALTPEVAVYIDAAPGAEPAFVRVVSDSQGNFAVAFSTQYTDGSSIPMIRLFSADGTPRADAYCALSGCQKAGGFDLGMDAAGNFVVAFGATDAGGGTVVGIDAQRFAADGTARDAQPFVVVTAPAQGSTTTQLTLGNVATSHKTGDFAVTWRELQSTPWTSIYTSISVLNAAQRYLSDGSLLGNAISTAPTSSGFCYDVPVIGYCQYKDRSVTAVAMDDKDQLLTGRISRLYTRTQPQGYAPTCQMLRYNASGVQSKVLSVRCGPAAANGADDLVLSYSATSPPTSNAFDAQYYNASWFKLGTSFEIVPSPVAVESGPNLSMSPDGNFVAAWAQKLDPSSNETQPVPAEARIFRLP